MNIKWLITKVLQYKKQIMSKMNYFDAFFLIFTILNKNDKILSKCHFRTPILEYIYFLWVI